MTAHAVYQWVRLQWKVETNIPSPRLADKLNELSGLNWEVHQIDQHMVGAAPVYTVIAKQVPGRRTPAVL